MNDCLIEIKVSPSQTHFEIKRASVDFSDQISKVGKHKLEVFFRVELYGGFNLTFTVLSRACMFSLKRHKVFFLTSTLEFQRFLFRLWSYEPPSSARENCGSSGNCWASKCICIFRKQSRSLGGRSFWLSWQLICQWRFRYWEQLWNKYRRSKLFFSFSFGHFFPKLENFENFNNNKKTCVHICTHALNLKLLVVGSGA